ncbi:MAG: nucleoside permease [Planctomycetota bacterium]|nr:MAG: nucleoside permease [Planctomycetota bacterium]
MTEATASVQQGAGADGGGAAPSGGAASAGRGPVLRLSIMMFLQYAVWGAWLPVLSRYLSAPTADGGLGFDGGQIGWIIGTAMAVGAVVSPFLAGQIADRWFPTERFLAVSMVLGGALTWWLSYQTTYGMWLALSILNAVVFMPTLALSNSMAFAHLRNEERDFPKVRVWGTIGWIAALWAFPMLWLQRDLGWQLMPPFFAGPEVAGVTGLLGASLRFSAMLAWVYALFCLTLPHTPPKRDGVESLAFAKAFRLFRMRSFGVLVLGSLVIAAIHQIYFIQTATYLSALGVADSSIGPATSIGQFSEIAVMALLGWGLSRFGFRSVLTFGALAYFARYLIWSVTDLPVELLVGSQFLHGVCYACFFATAFIYVDKLAPADVRHSAQTVFGVIILGLGPVLGGLLAQHLSQRYALTDGLDYAGYWQVPAFLGLAAATLMLLAFRDETARDAASTSS